MSNKRPPPALKSLLLEARLEVLPSGGIVDRVHEHVAPGRTVTVTASPTKGLDATLEVTERLAQRYRVVPHLAARMVPRAGLPDLVSRLQEAGVTEVFVPGGDASGTVETFDSALDLLLALDELGRPFEQVGITGYPESHPGIEDHVLVQSMWDKREHATAIVSNMTFDHAMVGRWLESVRDRGVTLPVHIGVPGPVDPGKLLRMATTIGVGDSMRFLRKQKNVFARIALPGFSSTTFVRKVAQLAADERLGIRGLHIYTFNQVGRIEAWRREQLDRL
ncbi:5,10-methylenetetrahydrofolate reductase [Ornithinimicrobium pratense]|uniref:Methylenetetrahydrofolate reductase n=1 Tax=Ornithinimicrobium pratense TaxID=2593973 RepID=A0A5J6V9E3_9MICO|nr:5,10-methylenetetrahydrofolate reductase [Ornithinimicrobium pratense]